MGVVAVVHRERFRMSKALWEAVKWIFVSISPFFPLFSNPVPPPGDMLWCRRDVCVFVFETVLQPPTQLQTTRSPRLLNGFWCFLVQNKEEVLPVSFLFSTDHFCWLENNKNFESSKKVRFDQVFFTNAKPSTNDPAKLRWAISLQIPGNNQNYQNVHFQVTTNN